ncbi:restriction endonuclease subunit S [Methanolobus bombayensis]|uniref:restriction endonuclease subunit S n=1 Tax=Methanolobus bombayensis TaxID=38023 RepID=UPI001AE3C7D9|nr:restriction endonuclease subunit S [Methanolobus bombayensis]MBP1908443.1 type I restriction enzyme S subunit [Methanolobus bombayensis]
MQQKSELPEGWELPYLKDILEINPSKPKQGAVPSDTTVTFVPMPAVDADSGSINAPEVRTFSEVRKGYTAFQNEDVIFAKITPCMENGKTAIARNLLNNLGFGSTEFIVLRSNGAIVPDYLHHYIRQDSYRKLAEANMTGSVGQKRVPKEFVQKTLIPLPPLSEQQRIVAVIKTLFARLDATRERLDNVPKVLKTFKQAVLAAACDGRLTEDWRNSNEHVEALSSPKNTTENNDMNLPISWTYAAFKSIVNNLDGKRIPLKSADRKKRQGSYPYYGASGIIDYIDDYIFEGKFLLISEDGANLVARNTPIAFIAEGQFWVNNHAHIVQTIDNIPLEYLEIFFNGFDLQHYITGSAQPKLTQGSLNKIQIPLPSLPEQIEIVRRVEVLFAFADSIEAKVAAAREKSDQLRQSILAKAFSGELVPTEAELARLEGRDYESAEVLLERIKAERASSMKNKKKK